MINIDKDRVLHITMEMDDLSTARDISVAILWMLGNQANLDTCSADELYSITKLLRELLPSTEDYDLLGRGRWG
jgi:hypothetical protein